VFKSHSRKSQILNFLLRPILRRLGYDKNVTEDFLSSHYYHNDSNLENLVSIHAGFLKTSGWLESKNKNASYKDGKLVPWLTYSSITFLECLDLKRMNIVEFGSGASTVWFSERCKKITSYEFDSSYASQTKLKCKAKNLEIVTMDNFQNQDLNKPIESIQVLIEKDLQILDLVAKQIVATIDFKRFMEDVEKKIREADLVVIDGGMRNLAIHLTAEYANRNTLVLVDNTDVTQIRSGLSPLKTHDFIEIPFSGLTPLNPYGSQTSLFLRSLVNIEKI
jgi:hypothetical protein